MLASADYVKHELPETALWLSVVYQAIVDCQDNDRVIRRQAQRFLFDVSEDSEVLRILELLCDDAHTAHKKIINSIPLHNRAPLFSTPRCKPLFKFKKLKRIRPVFLEKPTKREAKKRKLASKVEKARKPKILRRCRQKEIEDAKKELEFLLTVTDITNNKRAYQRRARLLRRFKMTTTVVNLAKLDAQRQELAVLEAQVLQWHTKEYKRRQWLRKKLNNV